MVAAVGDGGDVVRLFVVDDGGCGWWQGLATVVRWHAQLLLTMVVVSRQPLWVV